MPAPQSPLYDRVGGQPFFDALVAHFYAGIEGDPLLRAMYPDDLAESKQWLALFLGQYWGGPITYHELRGHPRLRARHMPFTIGDRERDHWMQHMRAAVEASGAGDAEQAELLAYFEGAATFMINQRPLDIRP